VEEKVRHRSFLPHVKFGEEAAAGGERPREEMDDDVVMEGREGLEGIIFPVTIIVRKVMSWDEEGDELRRGK